MSSGGATITEYIDQLGRTVRKAVVGFTGENVYTVIYLLYIL
jgi:hypothetical protein